MCKYALLLPFVSEVWAGEDWSMVAEPLVRRVVEIMLELDRPRAGPPVGTLGVDEAIGTI